MTGLMGCNVPCMMFTHLPQALLWDGVFCTTGFLQQPHHSERWRRCSSVLASCLCRCMSVPTDRWCISQVAAFPFEEAAHPWLMAPASSSYFVHQLRCLPVSPLTASCQKLTTFCHVVLRHLVLRIDVFLMPYR